ncbi:DUF3788 family protein [Microbacter margulisiae]|uniref:DUF3788 domain-containing protein n=1 Tax=Microbacter margulisiae TaxID=1350067 RepID=A0A7W5H189_9PORP|nr:DUF3788 family protein [Microbacter margulisiae]MBB3186111.1 hypothetical protein [Microbacter margulisiae]
MSKGFFINKNAQPTDAEIEDTVGKAQEVWFLILQYLTHELHLKRDWKFYGVNYGWALRFNKSGKSVVAIYPDKNGITVQIILNKHQVAFALVSGLDTRIIQIIEDTESIYEGKWIYVKIDDNTGINEILKLIDIRIKIK